VPLAHKSATVKNDGQTTKEAEVLWDTIEFPGADQKAIGKLIEACSGETETVENQVQNTFKLNPMSFMTTFQLCDTPILGEIKFINPTCANLLVDLNQLTIHAPSGFSKSNAVSSQSEYTFGSLEVCLPTQFSGGELVTRHQKKEVKYDRYSNSTSCLHWAGDNEN